MVESKACLFEGENFSLNLDHIAEEIFLPDEQINEKYKRGEIRIVTEQARYPLDSIEGMLDSNKYNLNPEYQRRKRWDIERKSRLIESFIMNVPIPPIFLYEVDYSFYEVMDGLQRLTAIYDFYKGKYQLQGLEYWKELNGRSYKTLPDQVKKGVDRRYLSSIVLLSETAKSPEEAEFLKQIVFERLNSGGEKLTPQETRNALYNGKFNQMCIRLAENAQFRKMWKIPMQSEGEDKLLNCDEYRKMADVELVLRFFAYRHIDKLRKVTVEKFLDEFLKQANLFPSNVLSNLEELFTETVDVIYQIFDKSAFLLPSIKREYKSPTKTIYDPMVQAFARNIEFKHALISKRTEIKHNLYKDKQELYEDNGKYIFDGRYNNANDVQKRVDYYHNYLQNFIS
jgi:hypothetical protein